MSYPGLSLEIARAIHEARTAGRAESAPDVEQVMIRKSGADFDEARSADCLDQCCNLVDDFRSSGAPHSEFDSQCAPLVHRTLRLPARIAGDPDFWRWLTFTQNHWGAEMVDWRYGRGRHGPASSSTVLEPARDVYYGLGLMKKGMFAKLWSCADRMHVPDRPDDRPRYDGIDLADVDLWDSHVIDVDYGAVPAMARAFVRVVRDRQMPRGGPPSSNGAPGYRDLAKEIRRRQATVVFELFDDTEAVRFIRNVWDERDAWCKR